MSNIIIPSDDSVKYNKDCADFVKYEDGTLVGEYRYCNLSNICRQVDMVDGEAVPMESHYKKVKDAITGEVIEERHFCTGMHDLRTLKERAEDDKVS